MRSSQPPHQRIIQPQSSRPAGRPCLPASCRNWRRAPQYARAARGGCLNMHRPYAESTCPGAAGAAARKTGKKWFSTAILAGAGQAAAGAREFFPVDCGLARQLHLPGRHRGPTSPPHRNFEVGPPITPVVRSSAPDPYGQDRVLLSGQRPHFFLFFAIRPRFCRPTLDSRGLGALLCGVLGDRFFTLPKRFPAPSGQRSFNWQSTAFVMRGLWVRFPPLALHLLS